LSGPRVSTLGDSAVTLTFGDGISQELNDLVVMEAEWISALHLPGVLDVVPAYASLTVHYDPGRISYVDLVMRLRAMRPIAVERSETPSASHIIPVRYDGEDLKEVAEKLKLAISDIIAIHSAREYRVFVIGFVPGFAYLGPLDERLVLPRRDAPRKRVPAGSVAIAETQTGVYPSETPGGWHLIGTTEVRMFDPGADKPALLSVGDRVRFVQS
jgi:KipI family sensor histidine kinase inhibitor